MKTDIEGKVSTLGGRAITVRCDSTTGCIYWMSDWGTVWDFVKRGIFRSHNLGPSTYGHTRFYIKAIEDKATT